jgi:hypothetical protein
MNNVLEKPRQTIIGSVFETYNYELFSFFEENRGINPANVERIKKSMQEKRLLNPIIVDSQLNIVDGQHRFTASKELGLSIQYIIDKNATIEDIPRLNTITKTWKQVEYLNYYRKREYKSYKKMYEFMLQHNLKITEALYLLSGNDDGRTIHTFKTGELSIKDIIKSNYLAAQWNNIKNINPKLNTSFLRTLKALTKIERFNIDEFIHKVNLNPTKLVPCSTSKLRKQLIEEIYNYKRRNKVNLRI